MGIGEVMFVVVYGGGLFALWMFYRALARIGEELADIKKILRDGRNRPGVEAHPVIPGTPVE